ncbi:MAG: prolipoprotein diacylglyceryl transferase [Ruminococcaceae bacterium]|nr:prolipoprotein diacylglyceryl transferase [Oscillospiraceae bacterium]
MEWIEGISPISFPGLGLEINPAAGVRIGTFSLHFYGLIIAVGLILAVAYGWKRSKEFGIKSDDITDGVLWIVPFAIICARLYYCIFRWTEDGFAADPLSVLYIWKGGLAIYGGVIGAVIGVTVFCFVKKIKLPAVLDLVALGFLIGQAIGRWGNFFNREAYGAETDFFLRMGLMLTPDRMSIGTELYYHPTFLYESLWNAAGFVLLHFLSKRRKYDGQIALGYAAWYGLGRALIEGLRTDSLYWGPFRVSQLLAAASCAAAVVVLMIMSFKYHTPEKLFVNQVAALEENDDEDEEDEEDDADDEDDEKTKDEE